MQERKLIKNQIYCGNCLQVLEEIPEKSIDLIFADPPYNLQLEKKLWRPNSTRVNGVEETWDQFTDFETYDQFTRAWLSMCRRILKDSGTIWVIGSYHNIFRVGKILQDLEYWILNDIVWIKNNPMPNFHGVRFTNAHETLIWAQKIKGNKYTFNYHVMKSMNPERNENGGLQMRSDWKIPLCTGKERLRINGEKAHPTQKPEALLERVILASSNPGDLVLDPFFGSGTTGAVAKRLGRDWIGIDSEKEYVSLAQQRIDAIVYATDESKPFILATTEKAKRIPFSELLRRGYIETGQIFYFNKQKEQQATVLSNGHLKYNGYSGSIHKVGRDILKGPCNGWLIWYYMDPLTGSYERIDALRQKARSEIGVEKSMVLHHDEKI